MRDRRFNARSEPVQEQLATLCVGEGLYSKGSLSASAQLHLSRLDEQTSPLLGPLLRDDFCRVDTLIHRDSHTHTHTPHEPFLPSQFDYRLTIDLGTYCTVHFVRCRDLGHGRAETVQLTSRSTDADRSVDRS